MNLYKNCPLILKLSVFHRKKIRSNVIYGLYVNSRISIGLQALSMNEYLRREHGILNIRVKGSNMRVVKVC
jgi:hypothetical protein